MANGPLLARDPGRRNPLPHAGLTQDGRRRTELARDYFRPDDRDIADLVLFGQRFARHVRYYDATNKIAGDWRVFFESDVTAGLAALARLPVAAFRGFQRDLETWLKAEHARDPAQLAAHARLAFHLPVVLLEIAARSHAGLPAEHAFVPATARRVARELSAPLRGLIAFYKGALAAPGAALFTDAALDPAEFNQTGTAGDGRIFLPASIAATLFARPALSAAPVEPPILALLSPPRWADLFAAVPADPAPYLDAIGRPHQRFEQVFDALTYNLLSSAIEQIYQVLERMRRDATAALGASLEEFSGHAPHYGLWLTFLRLYRHAQGRLNEFTGRHLDFYFRDVLRLRPHAAEPNKAHLLFGLAKGVPARLLPAGTLLRAGKDAMGRAVSYALENDLVVHRAAVAELRALRVDSAGAGGGLAQFPRAAAVARSHDGDGDLPLPANDPTWPAFGPADAPAARIGFAVADRALFLREGDRTIAVRAELDATITDTTIAPRWIIRLSGEKGWFEIDAPARIKTILDNHFTEPEEPAAHDDPPPKRKRDKRRDRARAADRRDAADARRAPARTQRILEIAISLSPDDPAIVPVDAKLHGSAHPPGVAVMEIVLDVTAPGGGRAFAVLRGVRARQISLRAEASGVRNLMLLADGAVADAAKPFAPFGAQPRGGAEFVVGSSEIFSKRLDQLRFDVDWETPYSTSRFFRNDRADYYNPHMAALSQGRWISAEEKRDATREFREQQEHARGRRRYADTDLQLEQAHARITLDAALIDGQAAQTIENPALDARSRNGFLRLRLPRGFGQSDFVRETTRALIALANKTSYTAPGYVNTIADGTMPREPYRAVITRIEAAYRTRRRPVEDFRHLHPFGIDPDPDGDHLFPDLPFAGALLIGVADFEPPARLTLLVQVADGSGDPLKTPPGLSFSYLSGDDWIALDPRAIDDKTENFARSAVLGINLPRDADRAHRVMPTGLHWLRISAPRDSDAFNRLLSVDAQAARAVFVDAGNDPAFLNAPFPAGTIGKLVQADPAIRLIRQPYNSFDGRPVETDAGFATRVSERLRHKDRAITMFDYEALVLEAFPRLYRVKCLGTTELVRDAGQRVIFDNGVMPGAVTVVTVPWTHGQNSRDRLRPYTDQGTLAEVARFLRHRLSPFVRLDVQNPKFEEVRLAFKVRFGRGIGDVAFYIDRLNDALVDFLTPWARPGGGDIQFGGTIWKSAIIDFLESQPHVDFLTELRLYHKIDIDAAEGDWTPIDIELVEASTARSILVPARRHGIEEVAALV